MRALPFVAMLLGGVLAAGEEVLAPALAAAGERPVLALLAAAGDWGGIDAAAWLEQAEQRSALAPFAVVVSPPGDAGRRLAGLPANGLAVIAGGAVTAVHQGIPTSRAAFRDWLALAAEGRAPPPPAPAKEEKRARPDAARVRALLAEAGDAAAIQARAGQLAALAIRLGDAEVRAEVAGAVLRLAPVGRASADALLDLADAAFAAGEAGASDLYAAAQTAAAAGESPALAAGAAAARRLAAGDPSPVRAAAERRAVADVIVLAPDLATWCAAVACWDATTWFPVLLDEPRWSALFCRAFRPATIVRLAPVGTPAPSPAELAGTVLAAWSEGAAPAAADGAALRRRLGELQLAPRGLVVVEPDAPEAIGGIALAAGRFQGLAFLDRPATGAGPERRPAVFADQIAGDEATDFAAAVAGLLPVWDLPVADGWGYLTLAGGYPFSYHGAPPIWGDEYALDDLLGRDARGLRHSVVGRLRGDAARACYQAMCGLFLAATRSLLVDVYDQDPHGGFASHLQAPAVAPLRERLPVEALVRPDAAAVRAAATGHGLVLINSGGMPYGWMLGQGNGSVDDLPFGGAAACHMIHSFSTQSPDLADTVAGRALWAGAYCWFGSMHEPFLGAFQPPALLVRRLLAGAPLAAAARQRCGEQAGQPWRLVCIGDPQHAPLRRPVARRAWDPGQLHGLRTAGEGALARACRQGDAAELGALAAAAATPAELAAVMQALLLLGEPARALATWRPAVDDEDCRRFAHIAAGRCADRAIAAGDPTALAAALAAFATAGGGDELLARWLDAGRALCTATPWPAWMAGIAADLSGPCPPALGTRLVDGEVERLVAAASWSEAETRSAEELVRRLLRLRLPGEVCAGRLQRLAEAAERGGQPDPLLAVRAGCAGDALAAAGLALLDAELARRAAYGRDWLVLGPFTSAAGEWTRVGPAAGAVHPDFTAVFADHGVDLRWTRLPQARGVGIDLRRQLTPNERCYAYAAAPLRVEADCDAWLLAGSDDGVRIWIDGVEVWRNPAPRGLVPDQDRAPVRLAAGTRWVVLRVEQGTGGWGFSLRFAADRDGRQALPGVGWQPAVPP